MNSRHDYNKSEACKSKTYFTITQALILTLQGATGKQTHELMNELSAIQEQMLKDYELNPRSKKAACGEWCGQWWNSGTSKRRTVKFPGTDVYITCNLSLDWYHRKYNEFDGYTNKKEKDCVKCEGNTTIVKASFYMPQRKLTFTEEMLGEIMLEGEIFDASDDIEALITKDSLTPQEKRDRAEAKKAERLLKKQQKELEKTP